VKLVTGRKVCSAPPFSVAGEEAAFTDLLWATLAALFELLKLGVTVFCDVAVLAQCWHLL